MDSVYVLVGIFDYPHPKGDAAPLQHGRGHRRDHRGKIPQPLPVYTGTAIVLSKADRQHLAVTALNWAVKICVRFDPDDGDDIIGLRRLIVHVNRDSLAAHSNDNSLHV